MDLSTNSDFLSGALASVTGVPIVPGNKAVSNHGGALDLDALHKQTLQWDVIPSPFAVTAEGSKEIFVYELTGTNYTINIDLSDRVENLKRKIEESRSWSVALMTLIHEGRKLEDGDTLSDYTIVQGSKVYLLHNLKGGADPVTFTLDPDILDPQYNYDFKDKKDDGRVYTRGAQTYHRPYGWTRVALNVKAKYGDIGWLGGNDGSLRTESQNAEWPVSYHGTAKKFAVAIAASGYDLTKGKRFKFGRGIYSTPDPAIAEQYATVYKHQGKKYRVLLQNRVNMEDTEVIAEWNYFVTGQEKNIRPYGLLYKKI